jgi:hypothetical protein
MKARTAIAALAVAGTALLVGCGSSDGAGDDQATTTTVTVAPATTSPDTAPSTVPSTTSTTATGATGSTSSASPSTATIPALVPGEPCLPGSDPDCIDPFGDGQYVYLIGGAECMASPIGGSMCADLDGDGRAGYPDSG